MELTSTNIACYAHRQQPGFSNRGQVALGHHVIITRTFKLSQFTNLPSSPCQPLQPLFAAVVACNGTLPGHPNSGGQHSNFALPFPSLLSPDCSFPLPWSIKIHQIEAFFSSLTLSLKLSLSLLVSLRFSFLGFRSWLQFPWLLRPLILASNPNPVLVVLLLLPEEERRNLPRL